MMVWKGMSGGVRKGVSEEVSGGMVNVVFGGIKVR